MTGGGTFYVHQQHVKPFLTSILSGSPNGGSGKGNDTGPLKVCFNDKFMSKLLPGLQETYGTTSTCSINDTVDICPSHATCYLGKARDCGHLGFGGYMKINKEGNECVLDEGKAGETVGRVLEAMGNTTLEHTCHCWGLGR